MTTGLVSIVLPVQNQAAHIAEVVEQYEESLVTVPYERELLLVVNGCRDDSARICRELAERIASVRVLESAAGGWGLAVRLGLRSAQGDLLCYTNTARTTGTDLALLLHYAVVYPDVVIKANRKIRDGWQRRLGSLLYNLECRALFDLSFWDINGTPKVFPRRYGKLMELERDDDLIDAEFSVVCRSEGYPVLEAPIFSTRRHGGKSTTNLRSAFHMYWGALQLRRSCRKGQR